MTNKIQEADRQVVTVDMMNSNLNGSVKKASESTQSIQEALRLFSDALNDWVTLKREYQGIMDKYANKGSTPGQSYNLPGIFATSLATYDINAARSDNQRIMELTELIAEAEQQKDYYYDALVGAFNDLVNGLQKIKKYEGAITEYMMLLQQKKELN